MNTELLEALNILEKEKDISKETLLDAIENSLMNACKNHFGKTDNIKLIMNKETCAGLPQGVHGPGRPIPVLPSPPPCGWSFGFITEPRTVGLIPM